MARTYGQLSLEERALIQVQLSMGWRPAAIAAGLQRARSTITREMARNGWQPADPGPRRGMKPIAGGYYARSAHRRAQLMHSKARVLRKLARFGALWPVVVEHLRRGLSPAQIAFTLRRMADPIRLSHETIYTALYAMPRGHLRAQVLTLLRRSHKRRGARTGRAARPFVDPIIVELTDAAAMEWQLVENSQRVDVHPYEEAQGFQRLLDLPGYDVGALVEKSGKSASHIYARLSLLQLIPAVAEAFTKERITASHANLIARLPQESQAEAFEQCWRKDWQDKEPHLLPAKHLSAWIQANLYLSLADAPFDREDTNLNPAAGACTTCPRRSGFNTSLFCDVQGDQCKLCGIRATASIFRWLVTAARPA